MQRRVYNTHEVSIVELNTKALIFMWVDALKLIFSHIN